jgi:hypothetical protein
VFGAKKQIIVLPSSTTEDKFVAYKALAEVLNSEGEALMKIDTTLTLQELSNNSLFLMGDISENKSFQSFQSEEFKWSDWVVFLNDKGNFSLMGQSFNGEKCAMMITVRNPLNTQESIAVFCATTPQEVGLSGNKLIHYGKYSYLAFEEGKNKMKGNWEIKRSPLSQRF